MRVAPLAAVLLLPLALACAPALAADAAEIAFWESVRESKDAAELRAYLERYPNGDFAVLARRRLAALENAPAGRPQAAPAPVARPAHALQAGDSWVYRLTYPRLRGQWGQTARPPVTHVVTLSSAEPGKLVDVLSVDGGTATLVTHDGNPALLDQGASIFSPYLTAARLQEQGRLARIEIRERGCSRTYACEAKGRILGKETVQVAGGQFVATRVEVDQEWRPASGFGANLMGSRKLTIWYVPEIGRAVKYSSRLVVGNAPPMDANFDLELVSYQLK